MSVLLEYSYVALQSYGLAIILLSLTVSVVTYPIVSIGSRIEKEHSNLVATIDPKILEIKNNYSGEEQFRQIEQLYTSYGYHPIKAVKSASGFLFRIPFLISSLLLLINYPALDGQAFLFITSLSKPDNLLPMFGLNINILPILVSLVAILESAITPGKSRKDRNTFLFVSLAICLMIYNLPSAIVLYWLFNNVWSLVLSTFNS